MFPDHVSGVGGVTRLTAAPVGPLLRVLGVITALKVSLLITNYVVGLLL